ncbi:hypothetical protein A2982_02590 [candidate division WWE3 bacterium RIFCSPLOWO2_01_FULL_39_13]|uniref:Uncharacterized protein n=1 Tax=candidate division WWE3 bacterium RIFCSPLOWO2_01_FULL_39_13 TaxID=1802624 RepID=A0A1F4V4I7_UNCKA|nr:MAG: hypothetical protein A2982_02590 [candidate division WWE3 bacterium RIFCSPLOWO2_01_FULL_39_13]
MEIMSKTILVQIPLQKILIIITGIMVRIIFCLDCYALAMVLMTSPVICVAGTIIILGKQITCRSILEILQSMTVCWICEFSASRFRLASLALYYFLGFGFEGVLKNYVFEK